MGAHREQGQIKKAPRSRHGERGRAAFEALPRAPDWRGAGEGMGTATPPGQGQPRAGGLRDSPQRQLQREGKKCKEKRHLGAAGAGCRSPRLSPRQTAAGTAPQAGAVPRGGLAPATALSFLHRHGWVLEPRILPRTQLRLGLSRTSFPSPATTHPTHSSPGTTQSRHATSPTHRLHGRSHVVVSLRLLGQAGSLKQLLPVPHSRFRGGRWASAL